jgi:hypothetical protein
MPWRPSSELTTRRASFLHEPLRKIAGYLESCHSDLSTFSSCQLRVTSPVWIESNKPAQNAQKSVLVHFRCNPTGRVLLAGCASNGSKSWRLDKPVESKRRSSWYRCLTCCQRSARSFPFSMKIPAFGKGLAWHGPMLWRAWPSEIPARLRGQRQDPSLQQLEPCPPVHLTLDHLQPVDLTLQRSVTLRRRHRPFHRTKIASKGSAKLRNQRKPRSHRCPDPFSQPNRSPPPEHRPKLQGKLADLVRLRAEP